MAANPAIDLQSWFAPLLATQREYARATEVLCQVDELSDFTELTDLYAATHHLQAIRQQIEHVRAILRLRMTIQMVQLARRFRLHFGRHQRLPLVNLDFRGD